jgi:hypothetical protein
MKVSQKNEHKEGVIINDKRGDEISRGVKGSDEDDHIRRKSNDDNDEDE